MRAMEKATVEALESMDEVMRSTVKAEIDVDTLSSMTAEDLDRLNKTLSLYNTMKELALCRAIMIDNMSRTLDLIERRTRRV